MRRRRKHETCPHCLAAEYKIGKLSPRDGDVLILRIPEQKHTAFEIQVLRAQLERLAPGVAILIVEGDLDAAIARQLNIEELGIARPGC